MDNPDPILLVEDSDDDALLVQRTFSRAGVENPVRRLRSGEAAMGYLLGIGDFQNRASNPLPVFVLLDVNLAGEMNGLQFLQWVRSQPGIRRVPVVVLAESKEASTIDAAYDAGANSYLVKGATREDAIRVIEDVRRYWQGLNVSPRLLIRKSAQPE